MKPNSADQKWTRSRAGQTRHQPQPFQTNQSVPITRTTVEPKQRLSPNSPPSAPRQTWQVAIIFTVLCAVSFIAALESTIITTALPKIAASVPDAGSQYIWITNSFILCSTAFQPVYGQLSDIFGRRGPYAASLILFTLGAGLCGGATTLRMLIAGRTVQGIGSAGMFVVSDLIVCDIAPLRERSKYIGVLLAVAAVGMALGPVVGGALAAVDWRWCFYINIPIAGPCLVAVLFFARLRHKRESNWASALERVDFVGFLIFIPSILSLLLGLVLGGVIASWSSWRIILPLVLGVCGWVAFHVYEASRFCHQPSLPTCLFSNRTTTMALLLTFIAGNLFNWTTYFFPLYFQSVRGVSTTLSGVYMLPLTLFVMISSVAGGFVLSKFGAYKPIHWAGFALISVGLGMASTMKTNSSAALWVFAETFASAGIGFLFATLLPVVLAGLSEKHTAAGTAAFSFMRSLGFIFGVTIPAVVFNNIFETQARMISDDTIREQLSNGAAYSYATSVASEDLSQQTRMQVTDAYTKTLRYVWYVSLSLSLLGILGTFVERQIELRASLDTELGVEGEWSQSSVHD